MPQLAQVLLGGQDDAVAALGIPGLVDDQDAARMRTQIGMRLPALESPPVERLAVPGGIVQEMMQGLAVGVGHDRGEFDKRLVVLTRQEQPNQVLPQRTSFLVASEEVVKRRAKRVNRLRGWWGRLPWSAHRLSSFRARAPVSLPSYHT